MLYLSDTVVVVVIDITRLGLGKMIELPTSLLQYMESHNSFTLLRE